MGKRGRGEANIGSCCVRPAAIGADGRNDIKPLLRAAPRLLGAVHGLSTSDAGRPLEQAAPAGLGVHLTASRYLCVPALAILKEQFEEWRARWAADVPPGRLR